MLPQSPCLQPSPHFLSLRVLVLQRVVAPVAKLYTEREVRSESASRICLKADARDAPNACSSSSPAPRRPSRRSCATLASCGEHSRPRLVIRVHDQTSASARGSMESRGRRATHPFACAAGLRPCTCSGPSSGSARGCRSVPEERMVSRHARINCFLRINSQSCARSRARPTLRPRQPKRHG